MWIFTPEGFYSVVSAQEFGKELQVRARDPEDLVRLRDRWLPELSETFFKSGRDYPCRAFCTRDEFATALSHMALAIDYSNFKSTVARRHSSSRAHIYGQVWSDCLAIENGSER